MTTGTASVPPAGADPEARPAPDDVRLTVIIASTGRPTLGAAIAENGAEGTQHT